MLWNKSLFTCWIYAQSPSYVSYFLVMVYSLVIILVVIFCTFIQLYNILFVLRTARSILSTIGLYIDIIILAILLS